MQTRPTPVPRVQRSRLTRIWRWAVALIGVVILFYGVVGYLFSASFIGGNPRWRGINREPQDFGLKGDTVSFRSQDGVALKGWWLPAEGTARASIIIAHGVDHTRQVMLPRASFLVHGGYNVLALDLRGTVKVLRNTPHPDTLKPATFWGPFSTFEAETKIRLSEYWEFPMALWPPCSLLPSPAILRRS